MLLMPKKKKKIKIVHDWPDRVYQQKPRCEQQTVAMADATCAALDTTAEVDKLPRLLQSTHEHQQPGI